LHVADALAGSGQGVQSVPHVPVALLATQLVPQAWNPGSQLNPQLVPSHVAVPCAGEAHGLQLAPQAPTAVSLTHAPAQRWKPASHAIPHVVPSQLGVPLATDGHVTHAAPQASTEVLGTHAPAQRWKPAVHAKPQTEAAHVGVALPGAGHAVVQLPQYVGLLVTSTQLPAQSVLVGARQLLVHATPPPLVAPQNGAGPEHVVVHEPHVAAACRSASQPLDGSRSQSAKPGLQVKPQLVPSHPVVALARAGQGMQRVPHVSVEVSAAQLVPHAW
jgi:hypothetical protein